MDGEIDLSGLGGPEEDYRLPRLNQDKWDRRYMALAHFWAEQCSKDPSTKVGAVLVGADRRDLVLGYNGFPPGLRDTEDRLNHRATKYLYTIHAERNALDNAKFDTKGATMVATLFPCEECAKSIIACGVRRVVCEEIPQAEPWQSKALLACDMFREAGVEVKLLKEFTSSGT